MHEAGEYNRTEHPLMRITTMGEFALERLVRTPSRAQEEEPRYACVAQSEWGNRGPAMALRHILRTGEVGSLLLTLSCSGETIFKLAGQQRLWVNDDAFLSLLSQAMRAECQGQNPLPLLEEAHAPAGGEFLEGDL